MARQPTNSEKFVVDEKSHDGDEKSIDIVGTEKITSVYSEVTLNKANDLPLKLCAKKRRRKECTNSIDEAEASVSGDPSTLKLQSFDVFHVEKEINVLVKLRCLLKVDKNTKNYVGKVLTSVRCESTKDSSSVVRRKKNYDDDDDDDADDEERRKNSRSSRVSPENIGDSSKGSGSSCKDVDRTDDEWKNVHLLTTTTMNFANEKLHELNDEIKKLHESNNDDEKSYGLKNNNEISKTFVDRSPERIHFSTPEVERKYRKIVRKLKSVNEKSSNYKKSSNYEKSPKYKKSLHYKKPPNHEKSANCEKSSTINAIEPCRVEKKKFSPLIDVVEPNLSTMNDDEIFSELGPIPPADSRLFDGMSFVLTCASRNFIDSQRLETMDSDAENEQQWTRRAFVRDRLVDQIKAGGGTFYDDFDHVPPEKYETTKLITNIPNLTAKSLLCLSVGIKAYNHQWIIRCCQENRIVNPAEDQLPAGWSLTRQSYVETFQRPSQKPFLSSLPVVVVIPAHPAKEQFISFWGKICENAGAVVLLVKDSACDFMEGSVVLTHSLCPSWLIKKAKIWDIPVVSTRWAIQCLIEGQICGYDAHPSFDYNYAKKSASYTHIL